MGYTANRRKELSIETNTLSYAQRRKKELEANTYTNTVPKTDRREVMAKKKAKGITVETPLQDRAEAVRSIPSKNASSPFYNAPIIGGYLKKQDEKTRKVASEVLSPDEIDILSRGLGYKYTARNMGGGVTQYYFDDPNVPEDVKRNFQSVMEKVDYAKKGGVEKLANRIGRQSIKTAVGDSGVKDYAAQAGIDDAGKVGNVVGDIAGTILGYNMPSGATGGGTIMGASNKLGDYAVQRAGTKIPRLINKPVLGRVAQGLVEDIPMTAYSALAERQSLGEAAKTYARNAPMTIGGELGMYGLGKVGRALRKGAASRAAKKAAGLADDVVRAAGIEDIEMVAEVGKQTPIKNVDDYIRDAQNKVDDLRYQRSELGVDATKEIEAAENELLRLQRKKYLPQLKEQLNILEQRQKELFDEGKELTPEFADASGKIVEFKKAIASTEGNSPTVSSSATTAAGRATTADVEVKQAQTPSTNKAVQNGVQDFAPTTPKQQKYVADVTAKLPDNVDGLNKRISDLTEKAAKETDKQKLLKINLQLFAAKKKLEALSKSYSNTLKNTDIIPEDVKKLLDEDDFRYDPLTEAKQTETARAKIDADAEGELRRIQDLSRTEYNQDDVNVGMELLHDLSNKTDLTDADIADIRKTAKGVSQAGRTQGRGVQAFAKYTRTKEGVIASVQKVTDKTEEAIRKTNPNLWKRVQKEAQDIVDKAKKAGKPIDPDKALSLAKKRHNIPDLTDGDVRSISELMDKYKNAVPGSREAKESWHKVMQIMSSKIPPTGVDKYRGLTRISYLLNPRTILVRNPVGNVIMNIAETIKDLPGAMVDKITSAVRKSDRTTSLPSVSRLNAQFAGMKEGLEEAVKDIKAGVDTSPTVGMLEMPRRDVFSNKWFGGRALNKADKLVGQLLQLGDRPFYEAAYKERIGDLMKLNKTDAVTDEMMDMAHDYALERVFQNDSGMAQFFKAIKTPPKNAPAGIKATWGFVANGIIPFSKTPANILNKLLEYSPVGLAKAVGHGAMSKAGKTVFNQKYFVDNIARGLTGTGLALLGYAMANKGLIKGRADKDKDVAALERLMGINSYSFTIDGKSYTFDWAQPIGSVLAAGADAYYSGMDKDNFSEQISAALQGYGNTFFNQSMMQNLTRFLNTYNPIAGVVNSVANTTNIVTPTLGAQAAKTIDPHVRDTSADTALGELGNRLLARTPGASMLLPKKIDTLGQPQMQSQGRGLLARAFEQFISPGYFGDVDKANETMKKIYDVYKETDEKGVFPKIAPKSFKKGGETIKLTADQKREWQKISGEYYSKKFAARTAGKTPQGKAKALKKLADEAYEHAKKQLF